MSTCAAEIDYKTRGIGKCVEIKLMLAEDSLANLKVVAELLRQHIGVRGNYHNGVYRFHWNPSGDHYAINVRLNSFPSILPTGVSAEVSFK